MSILYALGIGCLTFAGSIALGMFTLWLIEKIEEAMEALDGGCGE